MGRVAATAWGLRHRADEEATEDAAPKPSPGAQSVEKRGGALQRFRDASLHSDVPAAFETCR